MDRKTSHSGEPGNFFTATGSYYLDFPMLSAPTVPNYAVSVVFLIAWNLIGVAFLYSLARNRRRMDMTLLPMNLRLEGKSGGEEYRICDDRVEVRKLQPDRNVDTDESWHRLSHTDLATHVRDKTVVAQWLRQRLGWRRLLRACISPESLEECGIPENTLDRYAA